MKRHTLVAACMFVAACLTLFGKTLGSAGHGKSQQLAGDPASAAKPVVVQAAGRGNPYINFEDGVELSASYEGAAEMLSLLKQNAAEPRALASADFDEDGVPDLICGYARAGGGIITLHRGNVDSIFPNGPEAQRRKAEGTFTDSAFLSPARVFEAPIAADFVGAGDFDADGHWVAVLPMRLNSDALSDLVILQVGHNTPAVAKTASGMTFTVNKEDAHDDGMCDSDDCTMREAIAAANANPGPDTIAFNIPGAGPHLVVSFSFVVDPVTIDGTTQPGFNGSPLIFLTGALSAPLSGVMISAGSSVVEGVGLALYIHSGIELTANGSNIIQGNFIGTRGSFSNEYRNLQHGVLVTSNGNLIGGTTASARNVIAANRVSGVRFEGNASSNFVQGNFIGTDASGSIGAYFQDAGIWFTNARTARNLIGGTTFGARNTISGNNGWGVLIFGAGNNLIQGNFIGTDVNGGSAVRNGTGVFGDTGNTIGGTTPGARNLISGNGDGILISSLSVAQGNYIGTDVTGSTGLPNQIGVRVFGSGNSIGGVHSGDRSHGCGLQ